MNLHDYAGMSKSQLLKMLVNIYDVASRIGDDFAYMLENPEKYDYLVANSHIDTRDMMMGKKLEGHLSLEEVREIAKCDGFKFFVFNDQVFLTDDDSLISILKHEEPTIEAIITIVADSVEKASNRILEEAPNTVLSLISRPFDVGGMYVYDAKLTKDGFTSLRRISGLSLTQKVMG